MIRKLSCLLFFIILSIISASAEPAAIIAPDSGLIGAFEPIKKEDSLLILAPHPDDEAIGCAGIIQQAQSVGAKIHVAYLTNGDHNQVAFIVYEKRLTLRTGEFIHMGQVRRREAIKAMKLLGLEESQLTFLGYPDFGTFTIFSQYWQDTKPFKSLLTRISKVPYKENLSFGAPYKGESILNDLKSVLLKTKPNKIFVSHPLDVNVDHRAFYLFLEVALLDLDKKIPVPKVYPYLIHCVGWPLPRHYHPELALEPPKKFLNSEINWAQLRLTPEQLKKKYQAILCYRSQTQSSAFYLLSFARKNELFAELKDLILDTSGKLSDTERDRYGLIGDSLFIRIEKKPEIKRGFVIIFYLFGYSNKQPFSSMPKIRIVAAASRLKVFNGRKMIKPEGVTLESQGKSLVLKIPLQALGEPDFILTSIKRYTGVLPVDAAAFRRIKIIRRR
ncbi:MAG: PIG-L family deacetylase [Candidatus Omnitrophota bacterium]|jgi:LmbE family N-acetylglucosaminyl deacetylase